MAEKKVNVNVLEYFLVPKVRKLSDKEKQQLLEKYNVSLDMLPKIFLDDPIALQLSLKEGDVVEFLRDDGTGQYYYYRVAVSRK